jgi:hypothetical protein
VTATARPAPASTRPEAPPAEPAPAGGSWRTGLIGLAVVLLVAAGVRFHDLGHASFWLDEILTVNRTTGHTVTRQYYEHDRILTSPLDVFSFGQAKPATAIWTALDEDVHPPFFYLLLRAWRQAGLDGEVGLRCLSAAASVGAAAALFVALRLATGRNDVALWAAALLAAAGPQVYYAREMRSYTVLLLLLLVATALLVWVERRGPAWYRVALLGLVAFAAMMTHYAAIGPCGMMGVYALVSLRGAARVRAASALAIAAALFAVVWGPAMLRQRAGDSAARIDFVADRTGAGPLRHLDRLATLPARALYTPGDGESIPMPLLYAGVLVYAGAAALLWKRRGAVLWVMLFAGAVAPVLAADVSQRTQAMLYSRYVLAAGPPIVALLALAALAGRGPWRWAGHALLAAVLLWCASGLPNAVEADKENWRVVGRAFDDALMPGDLIVFATDAQNPWLADTAYMGIDFYADRLPWPTAFLSQPPSPELAAQIRGYRRIFLFTPRTATPRTDLLPGWRAEETFNLMQMGGLGALTRLSPA